MCTSMARAVQLHRPHQRHEHLPRALQPFRHRLISLLVALLAPAPFALVRADARPLALLAFAPVALVLADARPSALLALAPFALVCADARPPALLAPAPDALVLADVRPLALLAFAPLALVLADARPPALLTFAPLVLVRADTARLLVRGSPRCVGFFAGPPLSRPAAGCRQLWLRS
jgi:hypothetical protein